MRKEKGKEWYYKYLEDKGRLYEDDREHARILRPLF